jgi:peptide/nickel transport system substrate-binding protein
MSESIEQGGRESQMTRRQLIKAGLVTGAALAGAGSLGGLLESASAAPLTPKAGGSLRVGIAGGSAKDKFEPFTNNGPSETVRLETFYESMMRLDGNWHLQHQLLEVCEPNKTADTWTLRVKPDIEFHNGKTLSADDLLFSFVQMRKTPGPAQGHTGAIDFKKMKKLDAKTLRVGLSYPQSFFDQQLGGGEYVIPVGFDPTNPVSTGPWVFKSFVAGQQSVLERFPNYWGQKAYADELVFVEIPDDVARVNALSSGQVDAINLVPYDQVSSIKQSQNKLLISPTGGWNPITMRVDTPPFTDVRVRQAIRLSMNRKQAVETALFGQGQVAPDIYGRYDAAFNHSLHRDQDIEQAKSLLKQAGQQNLKLELVVAPVAAGIVQATQILAQNAKAAGIDITVRKVDPGTYFSRYGKWPFSMDFWIALPYLITAAVVDGPTSGALNVTHFKDPKFNALYTQASKTVDAGKRTELEHEMQRIQFETGGNIIWSFQNSVDAYSPKIAGFPAVDKTGFGLGQCKLNLVHFV